MRYIIKERSAMSLLSHCNFVILDGDFFQIFSVKN